MQPRKFKGRRDVKHPALIVKFSLKNKRHISVTYVGVAKLIVALISAS